MHNPKVHRQLTVLWIVLGMAGCDNPFATREPEPPKQTQSNWIQPVSPTYVLINLRNAVSEKNRSNYLRCLSDSSTAKRSFSFIADPAVANVYPALFSRWGKEEEANYLNQLFSYVPKDSTAKLSFERLNETVYQDSVVLLQNYELTVHYKCSEPNCPHVFRGQAEFHFIRSEDQIWYITKWIDYSTGDLPTWSLLKARFGQ
ncbi:MAG: hypothetical protein ONB12_00230 [candidate division KSB1 bacterium]|nr:hypothetical protein [candidate division KSB1 bacterium]